MQLSISTLILLLIPLLLTVLMLVSLLKTNKKSQLHIIFIIVFILLFFWFLGLIAQILFSNKFNINPIYFEYFIYISACFTPPVLYLLSKIFIETKIVFRVKYLFLFLLPLLSLLILWTNDIHHLFYKQYSISMEYSEFGPYMAIHSIYSYLLIFISCFKLIKYSIKNSGFFSKQSVLIFIGALTPLLINISGYIGLVKLNVYSTPISFIIGILCFATAAFKLQFFAASPIALQKIVDKISDGYIIVNDNNLIVDYNKTFLTMFNIDSSIRNKNIYDVLKKYLENKNNHIILFENSIDKIKNNHNDIISFDIFEKSLNKYFSIETSGITSENKIIAIIILFKDTTQHNLDLQTIKNNQDTLMERERLASLGQLIGGIAHNLKTPIMSIAGATEGIIDLIREYDSSIEDPEVNFHDHHDIANDMMIWTDKIKDYTEYMSDIITAVKGQAVAMSETDNITFDIEELVKRIDILMKHELKNAIVYLNVSLKVSEHTILRGDINSLIQVINNMISNSIQSYEGKPNKTIDLIFDKDSSNNLLIKIIDYGVGIPEKVKNKLFSEMITTKGKNGTGLGLYMSYSTIKAHFSGNITFDSELGKGSTFTIILPLY